MSMTPSRRTLEKVTLADIAVDSRHVVVKCNLCRRTRAYLATDLVKVYPPTTPAYGMFSWCGRCGRGDYVVMSIRFLAPDERVMLRRPVVKWVDELWGKQK